MKLQKIITLCGSLAAIAFLAFGTACNTTHGFGKDVEDAGEGIQDAAN
jgi:predicted small secreted protein